jgi:hypothetical protein
MARQDSPNLLVGCCQFAGCRTQPRAVNWAFTYLVQRPPPPENMGATLFAAHIRSRSMPLGFIEDYPPRDGCRRDRDLRSLNQKGRFLC